MDGICVCGTDADRPDSESVACQNCNGHVAFEFSHFLFINEGSVPLLAEGNAEKTGLPPGSQKAPECRDYQTQMCGLRKDRAGRSVTGIQVLFKMWGQLRVLPGASVYTPACKINRKDCRLGTGRRRLQNECGFMCLNPLSGSPFLLHIWHDKRCCSFDRETSFAAHTASYKRTGRRNLSVRNQKREAVKNR